MEGFLVYLQQEVAEYKRKYDELCLKYEKSMETIDELRQQGNEKDLLIVKLQMTLQLNLPGEDSSEDFLHRSNQVVNRRKSTAMFKREIVEEEEERQPRQVLIEQVPAEQQTVQPQEVHMDHEPEQSHESNALEDVDTTQITEDEETTVSETVVKSEKVEDMIVEPVVATEKPTGEEQQQTEIQQPAEVIVKTEQEVKVEEPEKVETSTDPDVQFVEPFTPVISRAAKKRRRSRLYAAIAQTASASTDIVQKSTTTTTTTTTATQEVAKQVETVENEPPAFDTFKTPVISRKNKRKRAKRTPVTPLTPTTESVSVVQPTKKRKTDFSAEPDLDARVRQIIKTEFVGNVTIPLEPRRHRGSLYEEDMPKSIHTFCTIEWPANVMFANHSELPDDLANSMHFNGIQFEETRIEEWDQFEYLRENNDVCMIGLGEELIVTHLDPVKHRNVSDFDVFIIRPYANNLVSGPFTISSLLSQSVAYVYSASEEAEEEGEEINPLNL